MGVIPPQFILNLNIKVNYEVLQKLFAARYSSGVVFIDGICGACRWEKESKIIDWKQRENELKDIAQNAKSKAKGAYDCVVGVSGGKDSTFQAFYARDVLGLRVLLVNHEPMEITPIGRANFENLKNHGFETISINPNRHIAKKLMKKAFWE